MSRHLRRPLLLVLSISLLLAGVASCENDNGGDSGGDSDEDVTTDASEAIPSDAAADATPWTPVPPQVEKRGVFSLVWLSGTPYEMGHQHGELLHDVIAEAMSFVSSDPVLSAMPIAAKTLGILDMAREQSYPSLLEECQGLVDATADTGFTMELCLILNFGDILVEFLASGLPPLEVEGPGCSGAILSGAATADGRLLHTRNLDWGSFNIDLLYHNPVIFLRQPKDAIPHVVIGFPLNLAPYSGMNLAGISIGSHEADPASANSQSRVGRSHVQMVGELLRQAQSLTEVEAFLSTELGMTTEMLVVGDGVAREGAVFELTARAIGVRSQQDDVVYATNHFEHPDMVALHESPSEGSLERWKRLGQLLDPSGAETFYGDVDLASLAGIMRDTVDPRRGVAFSEEEMAAADWDTDVALGVNAGMHFAMFAPEQGLFYVVAGEPPLYNKTYQCFSLQELLGIEGAERCVASEVP